MIAICTPARRLASVDWAATPTITPMIPADASSPAPRARTWEKVISIAVAVTNPTITDATPRAIVACVVARRCRRLSGPDVSIRSVRISQAAPMIPTTSHPIAAIIASTTACRARLSVSGSSSSAGRVAMTAMAATRRRLGLAT